MVELRYAVNTKHSAWFVRESAVSAGLLRRVESTPKRLYFKLKGSTLSAHPSETYPELWRFGVVDVRDVCAPECTLTVRLEKGGSVTLRAENDTVFALWVDALKKAAQSSFNKFYKREKFLGKGHFSAVYMASDRQTGEKFAVKIIKKDKDDLEKSRKFIRREVKVLSVTSHEHLIKAVDFFSCNGKPHIVMEYIEGGSLKHLISKYGRLEPTLAKRIIKGILSGVAYLHMSNIVHRDLKPENILMVKEDFPKITDFGLATFCSADEDGRHIHSVVGTPSYVAPEVMRNVPYGPPADVWACGVILYYMLVGERPFKGDNRDAIKRAVLEGHLRFPVDSLGPQHIALRHLISCMLAHDQRSRISAHDALAHDWLTDAF